MIVTIQQVAFGFAVLLGLYFLVMWLFQTSEESVHVAPADNPESSQAFLTREPDQRSSPKPPRRQKFSALVELTSGLPEAESQAALDLDDVAALHLRQPCSVSGVTLALTAPALNPGIDNDESGRVNASLFQFDLDQNKRHLVETGERRFIVSLQAIETLDLNEGTTDRLRFTFGVLEQ